MAANTIYLMIPFKCGEFRTQLISHTIGTSIDIALYIWTDHRIMGIGYLCFEVLCKEVIQS